MQAKVYVPDDPDLFAALESLYDAVEARYDDAPVKALAMMLEVEHLAQKMLTEHDFHEWSR